MAATTDTERKTVELLAPGGSVEGIHSAVNAGADAVYAAGRLFGARAYADNPGADDLIAAIDYCHLHGVRFYLTVNTLLKPKELERMLYDYMRPLYECGVDAVLVQDFGVFRFLRQYFPDLPIHASTQMTVTGADGVRLLSDMGASRVVLARELSLDEIRYIHSQTDIELETFVHGAMCCSYSGQCLMSSMIGGRSGNRGRCAQPCRLAYSLDTGNGMEKQSGCLLSLRDMCTLRIIPDIIEAGVTSLKIEGRMKSPEYAAGVTAVYRKYIDMYLREGRSRYRIDHGDETLLEQLFSRGPFSEGYYRRRNGAGMIQIHDKRKSKGAELRKAQETVKGIHELYSQDKTLNITGFVRIHSGVTSSLTLCDERNLTFTSSGAAASKALKSPLTDEDVKKHISRCGGTGYSFSGIKTDMDDDAFLPVSALNELRRTAIEGLRKKEIDLFRRKLSDNAGEGCISSQKVKPFAAAGHAQTASSRAYNTSGDTGHMRLRHPEITASVCSMQQLRAVIADGKAGGIYLDHALWTTDSIASVKDAGLKVYLMMPEVWRSDTETACERAGFDGLLPQTDGILVRSLDQAGYLRRKFTDIYYSGSTEIIADAGLYTWNSEAVRMLHDLGFTMSTVPYECTVHELKARSCENSELVIYGFTPLMITAQCFAKNARGCLRKSGISYLKDRTGTVFPVKNDCSMCTNTIYNSVPLILTDISDEIKSLEISSVRYSFTVEDGRQTTQILNGILPDRFTRGHMRKGVE